MKFTFYSLNTSVFLNRRLIVLLFLAFGLQTLLKAAEKKLYLTSSTTTYYIALDGSDNNDGSITRPWKNLKYAFDKVKGGDTILFREGVYHTSSTIKNFKTKNGLSITISAFPGEKVVFDGTSVIDANWSFWKNGIYRTKVKHKFWQLFIDDAYADMARWPNTSFEKDSIWRMTRSMRGSDGGFRREKYTGKSRYGLMYDAAFKSKKAAIFNEGDSRYDVLKEQQSLAESGIDFTGAYAVLNIGNWLTWTRQITAHKPGQSFFNYDTTGIKEKELKSHGAYYIYGLQALDKVNEWWYDKNDKYLYYKPSSKQDLQTKVFRGRTQNFALQIEKSSNITIDNIDFFATGFFVKDSDNIRFENCNLKYTSANKFVLGITNWFTAFNRNRSDDNLATSIFRGNNCAFINCTVYRSNAPVYLTGNAMKIENCLFDGIEWDVNSNGASGSVLIGANSTMERCTLIRAGNSEGIRPMRSGVTLRLNRIVDVGNLQHDGAGINVGTKHQKNALIENNWVHDSNRQGVRFDYHGTGVFMPNGAVYGDGIYRNNVTWNTQPNQVKGDRHLILNNTVVNCNSYKNPFEEQFNMSIHGFKAMHEIEANAHSITRNNLAKLTHRSWNLKLKGENKEFRIRKDGYKQPKAQVLPGINDHNTDTSGAAFLYLRDPNNLDFRPKKESPIVDAGAIVSESEIPSSEYVYTAMPFEGAAPDIGAYEYGADSYWIPGRQEVIATVPIPLNETKTAKKDADLIFLGAKDADKHYVYFGTDKESLKKVTTLKGGKNIYSPKKLREGTTYYWRVDAKIGEKVTKGTVWKFTVAAETDF
ncbi:MAG: right-handed parallel beta-helix repeat-containing protein [Flavicella sp.]